MAFVLKKERFSAERQEVNDAFYIGHDKYDVKKSVAPFNSTVSRLPAEKVNTKPETDFEKNYKTLYKKKELVYQKIKEKKQNKRSALSTEVRFKPSDESKLGPGVYDTYGHELYEFARKTEKPSIVQRQPVQKPPANVRSSIPYKIKDLTQDVIVGEREVMLHTGTNRKIGPGAYDPKIVNDNSGVVSWNRMKVKQSITEELMVKVNPNLGPGSYNPKYDPNLQYKSNAHSVFIDRKTHSKFANTENAEYIKNAVPGPGHYNPKISSVPVKKKKTKFELFGVSVPRFSLNYNNLTAVGPGSYELSTNIVKYNFHNTRLGNMRFGDDRSRFCDIENSHVPGPGAYIDKISLIKESYNKLGNYLDQNSRFKEQKEKPEIKPHNPEFELVRVVRSKQEKVFRIKSSKKAEVPFMSNLDRQYFGNNKDKLPAVGQYDPKNHELGYQICNKKNSKNKHVAFLSKTTRFGSVKTLKEGDKENSINLENINNSIFRDLPTYHDYPTNKTGQPDSVFKSKTKRFEHEKKTSYRFYGQRPEWNIKSFNIHF